MGPTDRQRDLQGSYASNNISYEMPNMNIDQKMLQLTLRLLH